VRESTKIPKLISIALFYNYKLPNPSGRDSFMVSGQDASSETSIRIYNMQGQLMKETISSSQSTIDLQHDLPAGSYLVRVRDELGVFTKLVQVLYYRACRICRNFFQHIVT
jgi:hypothetical protein